MGSKYRLCSLTNCLLLPLDSQSNQVKVCTTESFLAFLSVFANVILLLKHNLSLVLGGER